MSTGFGRGLSSIPSPWKLAAIITVGVGAAILILSLVIKLVTAERDENNNFVNSGIVQEREAAKTEVLNNVEKAIDARNNPSDAERRTVCSQYDRNCANNQ